ncbi:major facilitator superfamily domain-containing protein [Mrakia frigida]|uniref:Fmp42p n=1 Tax=Mrakia frigida TaxID=29902 RepID=UPI003FCC10EA
MRKDLAFLAVGQSCNYPSNLPKTGRKDAFLPSFRAVGRRVSFQPAVSFLFYQQLFSSRPFNPSFQQLPTFQPCLRVSIFLLSVANHETPDGRRCLVDLSSLLPPRFKPSPSPFLRLSQRGEPHTRMLTPSDFSFRRKLAQVLFGVLFCFLSAGVIFGFAALKPVLIGEGVYEYLCTTAEREASPPPYVCKAQDLRLNTVFSYATVATNVAALPIGVCLDRAGPKKTSLLGAVFFALGCGAMALNITGGAIDTYMIGYFLLALGGPLIFLPSFHLSNTFPAHSGLILSALTGAFDSSSFPFLIYRLAYDRFGSILSLKRFFLAYLVVPLIIIIQQSLLAPSAVYSQPSAPPSAPTENTSLLPNSTAVADDEEEVDPYSSGFSRASFRFERRLTTVEAEKEMMRTDRLMGKMVGESVKRQVGSSWFVLVLIFLVVHMTRINWLIQTSFAQFLYFTGSEALASRITTAFTVLLPLGGILGIPIIGVLLDHSTSFASTLVLMALGVIYGILTMAETESYVWVGLGVFSFLRPLMYTYVSDVSMKVFGTQNFGTVYGLINTLSGLCGLLLHPLDLLVHEQLNGDFRPVNAVLAFAGFLSCGALAVRIYSGTRPTVKLPDSLEEIGEEE